MFTLVPSDFFDPISAREALASVCPLGADEGVKYIELHKYGAVLVYSVHGDAPSFVPPIYEMLTVLPDCPEYNKLVCSRSDGYVHIAIAQGNNLLLANAYQAPDFITAEYFIFLAMKSLQLNPEVSTICWRGSISPEEEVSLCRYFKSVEVI